MESYETVVEAIEGLRKEGYTEDFNLGEDYIGSSSGQHKLSHEDFKIDKFFRFEGESEPDEEAIVYALSSDKYHLKGVLINAYGMYGDNMAAEMIEKLKVR